MLNGPFSSVSLPFVVQDAQAGQQRGALLDADLVVVEGDVVVDVRRAVDQPVVRDDLDPVLSGVGQLLGQRGAVDRGDDQGLGPVVQHRLDLLLLVLHLVVAELQVDLVAERLQLLLDVRAVVDPALRRLGRHGHPDQGALVAAPGSAEPSGAAPPRVPPQAETARATAAVSATVASIFLLFTTKNPP